MKTKPTPGQTSVEAFRATLDGSDLIGRWEWDLVTDQVRVDAFVARLFNVDREDGENGLPLAFYIDSIHVDDRERVWDLIVHSARKASTYSVEYRVISVDGQTRWVLARGRFTADHVDGLRQGTGTLVDITQRRMVEEAFGDAVTSIENDPLDRAAEYAIAARQAIVEMQDIKLKSRVDALLLELGRRLAKEDVRSRRGRMN